MDIAQHCRQWAEALETQTIRDSTVAEVCCINGEGPEIAFRQAADEIQKLRAERRADAGEEGLGIFRYADRPVFG